MTRSLPRWVHRHLPRAAPPDSWRSLRSARVPPVDYLDKPLRLSLGATPLNPGVQFSMSKRVQFRTSVDKQARSHAEALALGMGITFYVVRSREGRFLPVQLPSDDCEILATVTPPGSGRYQTLGGATPDPPPVDNLGSR
jgi:hypothetical protein